MTQPAAPIELTGTAPTSSPATVADRVDADAARAPRGRSARHHVEAETAEASRDWWPLAMHWSLAASVPQRAAAVCRPTDHRAGRRRAVGMLGEPGAGHGRGGRSGVSGRRSRCSAAWCSTSPRCRASSTSTTVAGVVEVLAGTFGPDLETELRRARRHDRRPLPAELRHRHGRRMGGVPRRRAVQHPLRQDRGDGRRPRGRARRRHGAAHRSRPGGSDGARPHPALPRQRGHARRDHPRCWLRAHPVPTHERRAAYTLRRLRVGHRGVPAASCAAARRPRCCACTTPSSRSAATAATARGARCWCSTRATSALVEATMAVVEDECAARTPGADDARRAVARPPQRHARAAGADPQGLRRRHDGDRRAVVAAAGDLRRRPRRADGRAARSRAPAATCRTATSTAPASTSRSPPTPPPDEIEATYVAMWDAGQRAVLAAGGNLSHHHGVGLNRARFMAEALGPALDVLQAVKDALDPHGILNPGKLGLLLAVRRGRLAVSTLDWNALRAGGSVALVFAVPSRWRRASSPTATTTPGWRRCSASPRWSGSSSGPAWPRGCNACSCRSSTGSSARSARTPPRKPSSSSSGLIRGNDDPLAGGDLQPHRGRRRRPHRWRVGQRAASTRVLSHRQAEVVMSILVVDVGTSGLRAAVVDGDGASLHSSRASAVDTVPRAGRVRRRGHGRGSARQSPRSRCRGRAGAPSASPTNGPRRSCGIAQRAADRPGSRLAGPADGVRLHHRQGRARPGTGPEPVGDQGRLVARQHRRARERDLCFGTVDTWVAWGLSWRRPRDRSVERRSHRAAQRRQHRMVGQGVRGARRTDGDAAGHRRLDRRVRRGGRATGCTLAQTQKPAAKLLHAPGADRCRAAPALRDSPRLRGGPKPSE